MSLTRKQMLMIEKARLEEANSMSGLDQAAAAAGQFAEGALGVGDEAGAIGRGIGGTVYDVFNTDKSMREMLEDNFDWDRNIEATRQGMDKLDEANPMLSNAAYGAGIVSGLAVPAATVKGGMLAKGATMGLEGAAYGALSGRDEGRKEGAMWGAGLGAGAGIGVAAGGMALRKLSDIKADKAASAAEEAEAVVDEATKKKSVVEDPDAWEVNQRDRSGWAADKMDKVLTGVSDAIQRRVSPEAGLRVQRADETAQRINAKEATEYLDSDPMKKVIALADDDEQFKGMLLDFGANSNHTNADIIKYVDDSLGKEEAGAMAKYLRWSEDSNKTYNQKLGDSSMSGTNYLHTQKQVGLPSDKVKVKAEANKFAIDEDELLMPTLDKATLERQRGLFSKGEVRPSDYANPLLSNATRIQSNNRLLELQKKFGIEDLDFGAPGLVEKIEQAINKKIKDPMLARDARNSIVTLLKGQNRVQNEWLQSFQNLSYAGTLAGPKSSVLNVHDLPVAGFNNGIKNMLTAFNKTGRQAADLERLGINKQTMGEFTQDLRRGWKNANTKGQKAAAGSKFLVDGLMNVSQFARMDRFGKRGVVGTVANRIKNEAEAGEFTGYISQGFDQAEKNLLQREMVSSGGDITKMSKEGAELYDEALTLGLGQQQLISAAGRPEKWLDSPNLRPLFMMRGFAIKQNFMLSQKIVKELSEGNTKEAAKNAAMWLALPGSSYAALNVGRNELFKDDYEATPEEFMWSMMDSLTGPATFNVVGTGSSYSRKELVEDPYEAIARALLPPGGITQNTLKAVTKAVYNQDAEELEAIITKLPIYKQMNDALK